MTHSYKTTIRRVRQLVIEDMEVGLVPFLMSSPGIGKSQMVQSIADEYKLKLIDHRLSTSAPEDMSGLPDMRGEKSVFKPFDFFPLETDEIPEGYEGFLLFLDEFNSADKKVQAASYKVILDRMVAQARLHPKCFVVCAGNLATDRAIVNSLGTAMQSRLVTYLVEFDFKEWFEDVVLARQWDSRIASFLQYKPDYANDFKPDHNELTFACPRTWEFMNRHVQGKQFQTIEKQDDNGNKFNYWNMTDKAPKYAGTITSGVAIEFITFCQKGAGMPKFADIVRSPETCSIPTEAEIQWFTIGHCMDHTTEENFEKVAIYINRFVSTFRLLYFRALMVRIPAIRRHPSFGPVALELKKYLFND